MERKEREKLEIYKNKTSGKFFIYIREVTDLIGLFVVPSDEDGNARIIPLAFQLFDDESIEDSSEKLLADNLIEEEQIKVFHEYK